MSLKGWFVALVIFALFIIFSVHSEAGQIHVSISPPIKTNPKTNEIEVVSIHDNQDGAITIYVSACGSIIELTTDKKTIKNDDAKIQEAFGLAVDKACIPH